MITKDEVKTIINRIYKQAVSDRRHLHMNPELSFKEYNTSDYICSRLDDIGISYKRNIAGTGVLAELNGKGKGRCLLLRADMDALPLTEKNESAYKSQNDGVMHACGHDVHTAILLNVCEVLSKLKDEFNGTIKFVFQPGEETKGGAEPMIAEGILENPGVDAAVALHVEPELAAGKIRVKSGALYASPDDFYITIKGKGAHGAEPQNSIDPTIIAAEIIIKLQTIVSRNLSPFDTAAVSVGSIHGGNATNVIPDMVEITGTARSLLPNVRNILERRIGEIVKSICESYGAEFEYKFDRLFPPLINNADISEMIYQSGLRCLGAENCVKGGSVTMAGEDFSYFCERVPAALFKLGSGNAEKGITAPIHSSDFDIDETCIMTGIEVFTDFILHFLR